MIRPMSAPALQLHPPDPGSSGVRGGVWPWIIAALAAGALVFAVVERLSAIPDALEREARARLAATGAAGVSVTVDGRDVTLGGELDIGADRRALVESVQRVDGVRVVVDTLAVVDPVARAAAVRAAFRGALARVDLASVSFEPGSASIAPASEAALAEIARLMLELPEHRVRVSGHTDSRGRAEVNLALSRERAAAVAADLAARGVDRARVIAQGYGATQPIADNQTETGRARNRRIEIVDID